MPADDEWALVARAQTGDAEAFGELYDRYLTDVYRFVLSMTRDVAVAEELTSRTFFTALRGIGTLRRGTDHPKAWLLQLANQAVRKHAKAPTRRRSPLGGEPEVPDQDPDAGPRPEADTADQDERTRRAIMVRGLLAHLPPEQRRCIVLRHVLGLSLEEVSRRMNRSPKAVAALTYRAMHTLRVIAGLPVDPLP